MYTCKNMIINEFRKYNFFILKEKYLYEIECSFSSKFHWNFKSQEFQTYECLLVQCCFLLNDWIVGRQISAQDLAEYFVSFKQGCQQMTSCIFSFDKRHWLTSLLFIVLENFIVTYAVLYTIIKENRKNFYVFSNK